MMRKLGYPGLIAALLLVGVAPVAAQDAAQPDRTEIRIMVPYGPSGLSSNLAVQSDVEGECMGNSLASPSRSDAWRCMSDNQILDPCFLQVMGDGAVLACLQAPWNLDVTRITLAAPVPYGDAGFDLGTAAPWAMELANGEQCTALTGATFGLVGLRANYGCTDGAVIFGEPDRSDDLWRVFYYAEDGGYTLEQVAVLTAWF